MIKLPQSRATDFRNIETKISSFKKYSDLEDFYNKFIADYLELDSKYHFSESFNKDFVFEQLASKFQTRECELFGMPFGVKDVFNTMVLPTTMGSEIWKNFKAGNNARIVDEIVDRGGIVFSKTTTAEFAVHYIQDGKTLNPHNSNHITGTSSAGSAVAVACGALPIGLGTQTAGSIVRPASFCGTYGFKPSFGAIDRTGVLKTADTLDTIGFIGSDIYGLRKTFSATFQKEPENYFYAQNYFSSYKEFKTRRKLRIGIIADQFSSYADYDSYVKEDFAALLKKIAGPDIELEMVGNVDFINDIHAMHDQIYCKSLSYYFQEEHARGTDMSEIMSEMIAMGQKINVADFINAMRHQPEYRAKFDPVIKSYDFLLTPSTASVAPKVGQSERPDTCLIWTFFGYPVLSLPVFWLEEMNLPFGLQLVAPKYGDFSLFDFGETVISRLNLEKN
jgi:Asp-tRNA(Asn)/Glu-tRNA(Gln) amidotransferase A subunit family amidase